MGLKTWSVRMNGRAVVLAGAVILAACSGAEAGGVGDVAAATTTSMAPSTTTIPPTTTTSPPATTTTTPPTTEAEPESGVRTGGVVMGDAELDMFLPAIRLTAVEPWEVFTAVPGAVVLQDPDLVSEYTRAVLLLEARPFAATIEEWAEGNDGATIESRSESQVGGLDAVVYDITYDGDREHLAMLTAKCCGGSMVVRSTEYYRVWIIDTGEESPLAFFVPVLKDDLDWLEKAERLIATVEFAG